MLSYFIDFLHISKFQSFVSLYSTVSTQHFFTPYLSVMPIYVDSSGAAVNTDMLVSLCRVNLICFCICTFKCNYLIIWQFQFSGEILCSFIDYINLYSHQRWTTIFLFCIHTDVLCSLLLEPFHFLHCELYQNYQSGARCRATHLQCQHLPCWDREFIKSVLAFLHREFQIGRAMKLSFKPTN